MSEVNEVIAINPPAGAWYESGRKECLRSQMRKCTVCQGVGGHYHDQHSQQGEGYTVCPFCKGTGWIQAIITFDWVSCGEVKELFKDVPTDNP